MPRTWGDAKPQAAHIIEDISFSDPQFVTCADGMRLVPTRFHTIEDVWDLHRGRRDLIEKRALDPYMPWASDAEVSEFLDRVADAPDSAFIEVNQ